MKIFILSIISLLIPLMSFGQGDNYWSRYNKSKCKELIDIKDIKQSKNDFEFRLVAQGCCWDDFRTDKILVIKNKRKKFTGQYLSKELESDNVYTDFKMKEIVPSMSFDTIYNQIVSSFLKCTYSPDSMVVVGDTVNGFVVPFMRSDDGVRYYFEIKYKNNYYYRAILNPESDYISIKEFHNTAKNLEIIKVYEVYIELLDLIRTELKIEI